MNRRQLKQVNAKINYNTAAFGKAAKAFKELTTTLDFYMASLNMHASYKGYEAYSSSMATKLQRGIKPTKKERRMLHKYYDEARKNSLI
jgi:hypothetical protein